jgi:hypothetical protein
MSGRRRADARYRRRRRAIGVGADADAIATSGCRSGTASDDEERPSHRRSRKGGRRKKRVDQITCEEFLALDPDGQQRIAYWVDGYEEAKGEEGVGTVAFDKFGNRIGALVEDCRVTPKEPLWQKLKKHI